MYSGVIKGKCIMSKEIEQLTESEEIVLAAVWDCFSIGEQAATLQTVLEIVNRKYSRDWQPQTASTFLGRLCKKHYLEMNRVGKKYYYTAIISKKQYVNHLFETICYRFYQGNTDTMINDIIG